MKTILYLLTKTHSCRAALILRLTLAIVFFPHGAQKILAHGWAGSIAIYHHEMGIPLLFAFLALSAEVFAPLALFAGLFTRVAAFAIGFEMFMAVKMVHFKNGFFMNWSGQQAGEGYEYHLLIIGIALALILTGGGRWSLDRKISKPLETLAVKKFFNFSVAKLFQ